jgi:hypothetical protein
LRGGCHGEQIFQYFPGGTYSLHKSKIKFLLLEGAHFPGILAESPGMRVLCQDKELREIPATTRTRILH